MFSSVFFAVPEHHYLRCLGHELGRFKINAFYHRNMDLRPNSSSISTQSLVFSRVFFAVPKPFILSRFLHPAQNHGKTHAFQSDSEWKSKNAWRFTVFSPRSETITIYDGSEAYIKSRKNTCNLLKSTLYFTELTCFLVFFGQCSNTIIYDGSEPYIRISKGVFLLSLCA